MPGRYRRARIGKQVSTCGLPVPFTFWPEAYVERGRLVTSDPWACLLSYIRQNIRSTTRQNRALAFLEQAQDFYHAAGTPRMGSKPLLLYYSFMNLVKVFLTVHTTLDLKRCIHGLIESNENIRKRLTITSQVVKIGTARGTHLSLYREFMKECGFPVPANPQGTKVVDLFEQIVGIHRITSYTLKRNRQYFPIKDICFEYEPSIKEVWISFYIDRDEVDNSAASGIRKHTTCFQEVESPKSCCRRYESDSMRYSRSPMQVLRKLVLNTWKDIWSELRPGRYKFWISSVHKDKRRAQLASGFQAMFFLGSVSRYRPDDFYKLIEGKHGWMVQEFINTQPLQFIYFLGSGIADAEMVVPELV